MTKKELKVLQEDIDNTIDAFMYECLIDIPEALGHSPNETHEYILIHILNRIKCRHDRYFVEEEGE